MRLTKYRHSCVRVDDGDRSLVIDPGVFSDLDPALDGVGAILVTHEHFDHLDTDRVAKALRDDSRLQLFAPLSITEGLGEFRDQVTAVQADEEIDAAGFAVKTFGHQHAVIHPLVPVIANVGYLIDERVFHPGDSFTVPPVPVETLLVPAMAPWSKVSEVIDYTVSVRASKAYPIHDALVNELYGGVLANMLTPIAARYGVEIAGFDDPVDA